MPTPEVIRQYAMRQTAVEDALVHYRAGIAGITEEIASLEAGLPSEIKTGGQAAEVREAKFQIARLEFDRFGLVETIEALKPEHAEAMAGPPDTDEESP